MRRETAAALRDGRTGVQLNAVEKECLNQASDFAGSGRCSRWGRTQSNWITNRNDQVGEESRPLFKWLIVSRVAKMIPMKFRRTDCGRASLRTRSPQIGITRTHSL